MDATVRAAPEEPARRERWFTTSRGRIRVEKDENERAVARLVSGKGFARSG